MSRIFAFLKGHWIAVLVAVVAVIIVIACGFVGHRLLSGSVPTPTPATATAASKPAPAQSEANKAKAEADRAKAEADRAKAAADKAVSAKVTVTNVPAASAPAPALWNLSELIASFQSNSQVTAELAAKRLAVNENGTEALIALFSQTNDEVLKARVVWTLHFWSGEPARRYLLKVLTNPAPYSTSVVGAVHEIVSRLDVMFASRFAPAPAPAPRPAPAPVPTQPPAAKPAVGMVLARALKVEITADELRCNISARIAEIEQQVRAMGIVDATASKYAAWHKSLAAANRARFAKEQIAALQAEKAHLYKMLREI